MARLTIFLGAFLAFLVEPLIGNTLLPEFGGVASVWNWCLAGFQILLVAGYFYAHCVSSRKFKPAIHCSLVAISALGLVAIGFGARSPWTVVPLVAIPFVLLAANSSLVQALSGGKYSLYSISNLGSFLGLFAYPFVFELFLPLKWQWTLLAVLVVVYAALLFVMARGKNAATDGDGTPSLPSTSYHLPTTNYQLSTTNYQLSTFSLSFASCFLPNAVTAHLCSDITPIPLMWVVLLGVYLLSYVIAFTERGSKYPWWLAIPTALLAFYSMLRLVLSGGQYFIGEMITATLVLLLGGIAIHAKLYRIRPPAADLTRFYLWIAIGGACGGAFCSFAMPHLATMIVEYPMALSIVFVIAIVGKKTWDWFRLVSAAITMIVFSAFGILLMHGANRGQMLTSYRNGYGTGKVVQRQVKLANGLFYYVHDFLCNSTTHGIQILQKNQLVYAPTAYFTPEAGGSAIFRHPKYATKEPMRVAVLGMGIGTLATYSRPGDEYMMCEINPAVKDFALNRKLFTFIPDAKGKVEIVVDDARKALERERAAKLPRYDVLVVDVFNGDAIPPHMATREAFELYRDRLAPDGILAVHITNWHLDLLPMVKSAAAGLGWELLAVDCSPTAVSAGSRWAFMAPAVGDGAHHSSDRMAAALPVDTTLPSGRVAVPPATVLECVYNPNQQEKIDLSMVRDLPQMTDEFHSLIPFLRH